MYSLYIHDDAVEDIETLWKNDSQAASRVTALLQEIEGNQDLLDRLTQHDYGAYRTAEFHISKFQEFWINGVDLWRIKAWHILKYRIVYAYIPGKQTYHILAIAPREFNYETTHPITKRILIAYEDL